MNKSISLWFRRFFQKMQSKGDHPAPSEPALGLAPLETLAADMTSTTMTVAQWTLDDNVPSISDKNPVLVEVEYFTQNGLAHNYAAAQEEELYKRITHYPPSSRLH